jgi:hypothetical protein
LNSERDASRLPSPFSNPYEQPVEELPDVTYPAGVNQSDYESDPSDYEEHGSDYESDPTDYEEHGSDGEENPAPTSNTGGRIDAYENAGRPLKNVDPNLRLEKGLIEDPWRPFRTLDDFKLAKWFITSKVSRSQIDRYFNNGLAASSTPCFKSAYKLDQYIHALDPYRDLLVWNEGTFERDCSSTTFFYRDIVHCVEYLLAQTAYQNDMVYGPVREHNGNGERMYSEMHTADWWWDTQVRDSRFYHVLNLTSHILNDFQKTLPEGATLVPIIGMSDQTHLTNFSGDKKAWPVYLTIGNILSRTRNCPSKMAIMLIALLPVPSKFASSQSKVRNAQRMTNSEVLESVFSLIFEPLEAITKLGKEMNCADGKVRQCFPVLAAWIADHAENETLHGLKRMSCPKCEAPLERLGTDAEEIYPTRDYQKYARITQKYFVTEDEELAASLSAVGVKMERNVFTGLSRVTAGLLFKPDILHNVYLGLFKHLMQWLEDFLKKHGRQAIFDDIWKSLPPYPGFYVPKKAYSEVIQWQGKEMRNLGRGILGVLASALRHPTPAQQDPFRNALLCVRALVDFSLLAQYQSHTPDTLGYMERYLRDFHHHKHVFQEFRTSKKTRMGAAANDQQLRFEFERQMKDAGRVSAAKRRRILAANRAQRTEEHEEYLRSQSHFNFIKIHLLVHYSSHVREFGNIPMYSTDVGELAHKVQIKEGYRSSNKIDALRQILAYYGRIHAFSMRYLTLHALEKPGEQGGLPEDIERLLQGETRLTHPRQTQEKGAGPKRLLKGPLANVDSLMHLSRNIDIPVARILEELVRYNRRSLKGDECLSEDIGNLSIMPVEQFGQLQIPVLGFQETDVYDTHHARTTGKKSFRNGGSRNDWVWVRVGTTDEFGALRGQLPGKLLGLFKLRNLVAKAKTVHRLAIVQILQAQPNGGRIVDAHGLVKVSRRRNTANEIDFWIVDIMTISSRAHLIPDGDGQWLVNSRIDLRTFNEIY